MPSPYVSIEKDASSGTWWFVQNSNRFFSIGINHVNDGGQDDGVGGRESTECKARTENPLCGDTLSFGRILQYAPYHNVTQSLYNEGFISDSGMPNLLWSQISIMRLKQWNFNTLGGWSNTAAEQAGAKASLFYAHLLDIGSTWLNHNGLDYDVFSQDFFNQCDTIAKNQVKPRANDTQLLGYQLDNEIILFAGGRLVLDTYLSYSASSPGLTVAIQFLQKKYPNIEQLNTNWNIKATSYTDIPNHIHDSTLNINAYTADSNSFLSLVAVQYFSVAHDAIRRYDSYHLILGVRGIYLQPSILAQIVKYIDVIDIHEYSDSPSIEYLDNVYAETGIPIYIGEFSFTATDSQLQNTIGARGNIPYTTQAERAAAFMRFVLLLLERPYMIGYHWWQFVDEPTTGRWPDGENSNYGLLHLTDDPYIYLTNTMSVVNMNAQKLHQQRNPASLLLLQFWSELRKDSFLDPTCNECNTGRVKNIKQTRLLQEIDGSYIYRFIEGSLSTTNTTGFNITLNLYYNPQRMDNAVSTQSPGPEYLFVRVVGYGAPLQSVNSEWPTCTLSLYQSKSNGEYLTTCQRTVATQSGYQLVKDLALLMAPLNS